MTRVADPAFYLNMVQGWESKQMQDEMVAHKKQRKSPMWPGPLTPEQAANVDENAIALRDYMVSQGINVPTV